MKRKTKITLSVLTSLLIGGGIGTAIGYGVWGNKEEEKTSDKTSSEPVKESANEDEKASDEAVKPAFRFGLNAPVKRAAPAISDTEAFVDSLTQSTIVSLSLDSDNNSYMFSFSKEKDVATNGMLILRFHDDNYYASNYTGFYPADKVYDDDGNPEDKALSSIGMIQVSYGSDDDPDTYLYNKVSSGQAKNYVRSDSGYFYLIIDRADLSGNEFWLGSKTWASGDVVIMHSSQYKYNGSLTDGTTKDIYVDVDKNYSKDTIISSISAKDLFGQDVPVTVTEGLDAFTPATIGVYTLKLKATDSYGQTATATVIVHIVDYVAPTVTQSKALTFTADKGQSLNYSQLSNYISVTDNGTSHGSTVSATYTYDGATMGTDWSKTFVGSDYGTHTIKVTARDGTGNTTEKSFTLTVNDGTAPVITRRDGQEVGSSVTVGLSKTFATTLSDIIAMYQAIDNVDGDVSASLAGASDSDKNFFTNNHKVGNYTITLNAKDKDNNTATITVPIIVSADIPPVFVISDTLVYTDTATPLSTNAINNIVANCVLSSKKIASLSVDASEYIGNEDKPGTYKVTYDYTEAEATKSARRLNAKDVKSGSLDIVVKEAKKQDEDEETENWFTKFINKIKEFFEKLGNWFKGVFTKFKFDCFITNEEWKIRFGEEEKKASDSSVLAPSSEESAGK